MLGEANLIINVFDMLIVIEFAMLKAEKLCLNVFGGSGKF